MDYELQFSDRHTYNSRSEGITIPAVLKTDGKRIEVLAKIDTGANDCLFEHGYGEALGLRVEDGLRKTYATVNSGFEAYGHEISIQVLGTETSAMVYFFADANITRNVARPVWLARPASLWSRGLRASRLHCGLQPMIWIGRIGVARRYAATHLRKITDVLQGGSSRVRGFRHHSG